MAYPQPSPNNGEQVQQLKNLLDDFLSKIVEEWQEKFAEKHGVTFDGVSTLPSKSAFYSDLVDDINKVYKEKFGLDAAARKEIKVHTVRRIMEEGSSRSYDEKTCDLLAAYVGYPNWAAYQVRTELKNTDPTPVGRKPSKRLVTIGILTAVLLAIGAVYWQIAPQPPRQKEYLKLLRRTSDTVPGKVTINYDLTGLDFRKVSIIYDGMRIIPPQERGEYSFDIIQPGMGAVRLYLNEELLYQLPILTRSKGWQGYVNLLVPVEENMFYSNGRLQLGPIYVPANFGKDYYSAFLNYRNYGVSADDMLFETRVLNNEKVGGIWAYDVSIDLVGLKKRIYFNILSPEAILYSRIGVAGVEMNGASNPDLKALCIPMDDWRTVGMRVKDKVAWVLIDGKEVFQVPYEKELGELVGIQLYLKGSGAVDWVRVTDLSSNQVKYFDDFVSTEAEVQ